MKPMVLGLGGRKGSGKSTLGKAIAEELGWPYASFGAYVRSVAAQRGLPQSLDALQRLGAALLEADCAKLCADCLAYSGWRPGQSVVVEGVRHVKAVDELRALAAPGRLMLVFIEVPEDELLARLSEKGIMHADALREFEAHSTEVDVKSKLRAVSDRVVDGTRPVSDLMHEITAYVRSAGA